MVAPNGNALPVMSGASRLPDATGGSSGAGCRGPARSGGQRIAAALLHARIVEPPMSLPGRPR